MILKAHKELKPYATNLSTLKKASKVYAQDKTPEVHADARVTELGLKPGGPELAASHLREIHKSYSATGVQRAVRGLQVTRGNQFVLQMMKYGNDIKGLISGAQKNGNTEGIPAPVKKVLNSNNAGNPLPVDVRSLVHKKTGNDPTNVCIYDNPDSHTAADSIGAKAFTVGRRIFWGRGHYNPQTNQGRELLAHEIAHTYQQGMAQIPSVDDLTISLPKDRYEQQADQFAKTVVEPIQNRPANDDEGTEDNGATVVELSKINSLAVARIQRAISFTTTPGTIFTSGGIEPVESSDGFYFRSRGGFRTMRWSPEVTIHGNPGDNFLDWEVGHHQVVRGFWMNIYWGTGVNETHRRGSIEKLPRRDSLRGHTPWYNVNSAQRLDADGTTRIIEFQDTPTIAAPRRTPGSGGPIRPHEWNNPFSGRVGDRGLFNYGMGFTVTLSARHFGPTDETYQHLSHMHWNFGISGNFDASRPVGSRVNITSGGGVNFTSPRSGFDPVYEPIISSDEAINHLVIGDT